MEDQPEFYKVVELDGEKLATIHAFSQNDLAELAKLSSVKYHTDGSYEFLTNTTKVFIERIFLSLQGDRCSWNIDKDITRENIGKLNKRVFYTLKNAVDELEKSYKENEEDISKN